MLFRRLAFKKIFSSSRKSKNADVSASLPVDTNFVEDGSNGDEQSRRRPFMCPHVRRHEHGETVSPTFASSVPKLCIPCQQTLAKNKQSQDASLTHYFREKIEPTIHTYRQASGVRCSCCKRIPTHSSKVYYGHVYCEPCLDRLILEQQRDNPLHYCNAFLDNCKDRESKVGVIENLENLLPKDSDPDAKTSWKACAGEIPTYGRSPAYAGASGGVLPPEPPRPASSHYKEPTKYFFSKGY